MLTSDEIKKQIELGNIEISNFDVKKINKPNSVTLSIGNTLYTYDDNDDLKKVTDIGGYKTSFVYDKHYVTKITDNDDSDGVLNSGTTEIDGVTYYTLYNE